METLVRDALTLLGTRKSLLILAALSTVAAAVRIGLAGDEFLRQTYRDDDAWLHVELLSLPVLAYYVHAAFDDARLTWWYMAMLLAAAVVGADIFENLLVKILALPIIVYYLYWAFNGARLSRWYLALLLAITGVSAGVTAYTSGNIVVGFVTGLVCGTLLLCAAAWARTVRELLGFRSAAVEVALFLLLVLTPAAIIATLFSGFLVWVFYDWEKTISLPCCLTAFGAALVPLAVAVVSILARRAAKKRQLNTI